MKTPSTPRRKALASNGSLPVTTRTSPARDWHADLGRLFRSLTPDQCEAIRDAFGHQGEITSEAAGAVIMDTSLKRIDEFFHISRRMRRIALQSAVGGMVLSVAGMLLAFAGYLPPVAGAVFQEVIDLASVLNALRAATPGGALSDY